MSPDSNISKERPHTGTALVVSGGDGTLFHLLQRLSPPYPPVVVLPGGRGNALARDLRLRGAGLIRADLMDVETLGSGGTRQRYVCASSVGLGYPATVTARSLPFRPLRRLSYAAATLFTLPRAEPYEVAYDGGPARWLRLAGILINNTRHVGGFLGLPDARLDDGLADAMELARGYAGQMAYNLSSMFLPGWWHPARVYQARQIEIRPARPMSLMLDGEMLPAVAEVRVKVLPQALPCMGGPPVGFVNKK